MLIFPIFFSFILSHLSCTFIIFWEKMNYIISLCLFNVIISIFPINHFLKNKSIASYCLIPVDQTLSVSLGSQYNIYFRTNRCISVSKMFGPLFPVWEIPLALPITLFKSFLHWLHLSPHCVDLFTQHHPLWAASQFSFSPSAIALILQSVTLETNLAGRWMVLPFAHPISHQLDFELSSRSYTQLYQ